MEGKEKGKRKAVWQLQEAKAMFSEVVKDSGVEPQYITVRGIATAVVLSIEAYNRLAYRQQNLYQFLQNSPLRDVELELPPRLIEPAREINL